MKLEEGDVGGGRGREDELEAVSCEEGMRKEKRSSNGRRKKDEKVEN